MTGRAWRNFAGHGNALAQAYNHMILPLANGRDKDTQIIWGIKDFEYRFGRQPEGLWLPETAVDLESLDLMAQHGKDLPAKTPAGPSRQDQLGEDMTMKLYVGNLSYEMTEPQLQTLFSEAGEVTSAKIITDRETGQARGFGFVEMETKLEGQKAISMLNGRDLGGRPLTVNEAKPKEKGGFGGGGGYRH